MVQLTDCIVTFVAHDLQPLSVVESDAFQHLLYTAEPKFQMPSRKHLSYTLLPQRAERVRQMLKQQMSRAPSVYLTVDMWSSRDMRSYIGITSHFVVDFVLESQMVACKRFRGSHTAENIHEMFEETIAPYDLTQKIPAIVTDNAANMVKAFCLPGMEILEVWDSDDEDTEGNEIVQPIVTDHFDQLPYEQIGCFAHTLQLTVKDGLKDAGQMKAVIAKVAALVAHVRRSCSAMEALEGCLKLQPANQTRWNSQLKMLRSLLRVPRDLIDKLQCTKPTVYEMKLVSELCDILQPFEEATDNIQGDRIVTSSMVIVCVRGLRAELQRLRESYSCKMILTLQASLETRLSKYETMERFKIATTLDPRFQLQWCNELEAAEVKGSLVHLVASVSPAPVAAQSSDTVANASPPRKRSRLLNFMTANQRTNATSPEARIAEVNDYLSQPALAEDAKPLAFWKDNRFRYPILSKLACTYLAIPASSAPVERLFSVAQTCQVRTGQNQ